MRPAPDPVGPGQESVWDYPRPPSVEQLSVPVVVEHGGHTVARTRRAHKVRETASPPTYYIPLADVDEDVLRPAEGRSWCEWKGKASYYDVVVEGATPARPAAWGYPDPNPDYAVLKDHLAFYADRLDRCLVDGVEARPQPGRFYGGWITPDIVGPFKGSPGSELW